MLAAVSIASSIRPAAASCSPPNPPARSASTCKEQRIIKSSLRVQQLPSLLLVVRNFVLFDLLGFRSWLVPEGALGVFACRPHLCAEHICEVGFQLRLPPEQTELWPMLKKIKRSHRNCRPQLGHDTGNSPVCPFSCIMRYCAFLKFLPQNPQKSLVSSLSSYTSSISM